MNTSSTAAPAANTAARLWALALATVMTLAMLGGVNTLAQRDAVAPQMATSPAASSSTSHA